MRYFRVKPGNATHDFFVLYFQQNDVWENHRTAIEQLIGCSADQNLLFSVTELGLKAVPDHLKKSFKVKPTDGFYLAKESSKIKKEWVTLAQKLQLPCVTQMKLFLVAGIHLHPQAPKVIKLLPMENDYYVIGTDDPKWSAISWAEELTERHFLEIRSRHLSKGAMSRDLVESVGK